MAFVYWLMRFSHEAITIELFLIACLSTVFFLYLIFKRRRYGVANNNISDQVVRAFLIELLSNAEGFKNQLFGTSFTIPEGAAGGAGQAQALLAAMQAGSAAAGSAGSGLVDIGAAAAGAAGAATGETGALRTQLAAAVNKQNELAQTIMKLTNDKAALETKLSSAASSAASAIGVGGGDDGLKKELAEALERIKKLQAMLAEYEVIEDDLANLKRYQQENKQLKAQLEGKGGAAPVAAAAAPAPAAASAPAAPEPAVETGGSALDAAAAAAMESPSPLAAAEEKQAEAQAAASFDNLAEAGASGASVLDSAAMEAVQTGPGVSNDGLSVPPGEPAAAPAIEPTAPTGEAGKSDADLLQEFEKMLNS